MTATSGEYLKLDNGIHLNQLCSTSRSPIRGYTRLGPSSSSKHYEHQNTTIINGCFMAKKGAINPSCSTAFTALILLSIISLQISAASVHQHSNIAAISSSSSSSSSSSVTTSAHQPIKEANDVIAIKEGADLDLSCPIVVHNEDMIISWTCDDEPANIRNSRIHVTDSGKLRIHSAKVGDSCNYRCEAADGFGTLSVIIKVIIVDKRLMDQLTKRAGIIGGSNSSLSDNGLTPLSPTTTTSDTTTTQHQSVSELQQTAGRPRQQPASSKTQARSPLDNGLDIEMHIEPSEVHIIWLKEYIGAPIDSLDEAIDKNLLSIDGVYYHSLNWPRATSYSQKSSTASSALLVKQSNYVHSGRYACFAGYPASIMNLHFNNSISNSSTTLPAHHQLDNTPMRPPMRYKIAQALVEVDDKEGKTKYKLSIDSQPKAESSRDPHKPANVFMNVISSNTWMRNLTVILLVFCISLTMFKFIGTSRRNVNGKSAQNNSLGATSSDCNTPNAQRDLLVSQQQQQQQQQQPVATASNQADNTPEFIPDHLISSHVPANSLMNDSNTLGERYEIDQALLNERLNRIDSTNNFSNNDHVYSEIGYQIAMVNTEEPYYKQPNRSNKL